MALGEPKAGSGIDSALGVVKRAGDVTTGYLVSGPARRRLHALERNGRVLALSIGSSDEPEHL